ncbi:PTS fructose transporter subunit IIA [Enterococcus avium]|nr:PTS fructose transporter subunit IIA [Enterococcus avium]
MQIVLASHSMLAAGMKQTAEFIMGVQNNLHAITAYAEEGQEFREELVELVAKFGSESVLFLTDLKGGSVNRIITDFIKGQEHYYLVAGMNLPLVLELLVTPYKEQRSEVMNQLKTITEKASTELEVIDVNGLEIALEDDF